MSATSASSSVTLPPRRRKKRSPRSATIACDSSTCPIAGPTRPIPVMRGSSLERPHATLVWHSHMGAGSSTRPMTIPCDRRASSRSCNSRELSVPRYLTVRFTYTSPMAGVASWVFFRPSWHSGARRRRCYTPVCPFYGRTRATGCSGYPMTGRWPTRCCASGCASRCSRSLSSTTTRRDCGPTARIHVPNSPDTGHAYSPDWSPDGRRLVGYCDLAEGRFLAAVEYPIERFALDEQANKDLAALCRALDVEPDQLAI